jgi:hypothetical protein
MRSAFFAKFGLMALLGRSPRDQADSTSILTPIRQHFALLFESAAHRAAAVGLTRFQSAVRAWRRLMPRVFGSIARHPIP